MRFTTIVIILANFLFFPQIKIQAQEKLPIRKEVRQQLNQAVLLMNQSNYEKSLIYCRQVLQKAILLKDNDLIAQTYNTIGANFDQFSDPQKSYFYYNKALIYADKTNNNKLKNWLHNNLANIYCFDKKEYDKGIAFYKKSLEYSEKIRDSAALVFTKLNMVWALFDNQQFEEGVPYLEFVNRFHDKYGSTDTEVVINMLNGMFYEHKKANIKAETYFKKAVELGLQGSEKSDLSYVYQEYAQFLKQIGRDSEAFDYLNNYILLTEELNDEEKLNRAKVEGINLKIDEYKREVEKIESQYKIKQALLLQEKTLSQKKYFSLIIIFSISIVLFYYYIQNSRLNQKDKYNKLQNKIQQNIINATLTGQEIERKKIASFLHDNISAILSAAGLHLNVFATKASESSEELKKTISLLGEAHLKIRDLSHDLIPALLLRFGLFHALEDLCEKNSNSTIQFTYENWIDPTTRYAEEFELKIYFIITELLNNIMKHSKASVAKIELDEKENVLFIEIIDNGKGFESMEFTIIEGFGISQIRARINAMRGEFRITSKFDMGAIINLEIPIAKR